MALPPPPTKISTPHFIDRKTLRSADYTLHTIDEQICILPDMDTGGITYAGLCNALYEYYQQPILTQKRIDTLGPYTYFDGLVVTESSRLLVNLTT